MHASFLKRHYLGCTLLAYATLMLTFRYYDATIFNEFTRWVAKYTEVRFSRALTAKEVEIAYHLPESMRNKESNVILIWMPMFGMTEPLGHPSNGCIMTYDRSAIGYAKAVVFHFAELHDSLLWLPLAQRKDWQRWIWFCLEPPWNTRFVFQKTLTPLNGIFNWTMTYRQDSDIYASSYRKKLPRQDNRTVPEMIAQKTAKQLGIWLVSNCQSSTRMNYIKELQRHIDIDVRGRCTGVPLCREECAFDTISTYKFYFAFENSRCKDYITEKFFGQGLLGGAVPVVMGPSRSSYEKMAPPNSFIHVDDFETVEKLAEYLKELDRNDAKYGEYLRWRSIPDGSDMKYNPHVESEWDTLCDKIKSEKVEPKTIMNLDTFWFGEGYDESSSKFSLCHPEDGTGGHSLHRYWVLGYTVFLSLCCLLTVRCCQTRRKV